MENINLGGVIKKYTVSLQDVYPLRENLTETARSRLSFRIYRV